MLKVKSGTDWVPVGFDNIIPTRDVFAFASFNGSNGDFYVSSGITSVDKVGTGSYDLYFESPQPDMNFGTHVMPGNKAGSITNTVCGLVRTANSDENHVNVLLTYHNSREVNIDPVHVCFFRF